MTQAALAENEPITKHTFVYPEDAESESAIKDEKPTLVIGDAHGKLDCLEALLKQEGIIGICPVCGGSGDPIEDWRNFCTFCNGDGIARINYNVKTIQLGDLGHFGIEASPTADLLCYKFANEYIDIVLWGNHDRALVDSRHRFRGYSGADNETKIIMRGLQHEGRLKLAEASHGFLITHAGLHAQFKYQKALVNKFDPEAVAKYINSLEGLDDANHAIFDAIPRERGGHEPFGGILWRDHTEKLYRGFPQVFGHSASPTHEVRKDGDSYNIDIGGKPSKDDPAANCLAGIWLPDERIVKVNR